MNINNFKITKNEPRINKYKGIKLEDDRVPYILDNYTQIKEVKELPSLEYTGEVYFSGSLADVVMASVGITENPISVDAYVKIVSQDDSAKVIFIHSYSELPPIGTGPSNIFYVVIDDLKFYIAENTEYQDYSDIFDYIGFDKSVVGTMNITQDDPKGTIGLYLIIQEPEDVSTSTIYKKEIMTEAGVVNTNYVFGEDVGMLTSDNFNEMITKITTILKNHGISEDDIDSILESSFFYICINYYFNDNNKSYDVNMYDNGKYIYKSTTLSDIGIGSPIDENFNTLDELYNFVNTTIEDILKNPNIDEALKVGLNLLNKYKLEYKYTNEPLNDNNLFLNVVEGPIEPKGTGVYQYYIYNGKEYIELGGKSGGATENIVKEINISALTINDAIQAMNNITFTKEEAIKLSTTSNLVILTNIDDGESIKAQVVNHFYNKEVMSGNENLVIIFNDSYNLLFEQANLVLTIQKDARDENIYYLNSTITPSIDIRIGNIQVSDWVEDTTYSTFGYNYKCEFTPQGLDGNLYINYAQINVIFGMEEAVSGNFAPYVTVEKRFFTIYAKEKPTKDIMFDYEVISR